MWLPRGGGWTCSPGAGLPASGSESFRGAANVRVPLCWSDPAAPQPLSGGRLRFDVEEHAEGTLDGGKQVAVDRPSQHDRPLAVRARVRARRPGSAAPRGRTRRWRTPGECLAARSRSLAASGSLTHVRAAVAAHGLPVVVHKRNVREVALHREAHDRFSSVVWLARFRRQEAPEQQGRRPRAGGPGSGRGVRPSFSRPLRASGQFIVRGPAGRQDGADHRWRSQAPRGPPRRAAGAVV